MEDELFASDPAAKSSNSKPARSAKTRTPKAAEPEPLTDPFAEEAERNGDIVTLGASESSSEPSGGVPLMAAPTSPAATVRPPLPPRTVAEAAGQTEPNIFAGEGLHVERRHTNPGEDVYQTCEWEMRTAAIMGERGEVVFEQTDCEIPKSWSQLATNVVVSKYFRGKIGTPQRETSVRQLVGRVADTIWKWGKQGGYFASDADADAFHDELIYLLLHQHVAFNSPVWFNLGVPGEKPQVSACFINSVEDTMESILTLAKTEGMLFKWGSGTGTNLSVLRSSREGLGGGGTASGPISFMRGFDAFAGAIKCLTPDAYVYTDQGLRTLGEVIDPDLAPGFHADESVVLATKDGPARISHVYVSPEADTFRLKLRHTGLSLRGTADHPVLVLTPDFRLQWKRLPDLARGERVAVSRRTELWPAASPSFRSFQPVAKWAKKKLVYPTEMTPELARLLGYMVAEGCLDDERFRFCNADEDTFQDFLACVRVVFGVDPSANVGRRVHPATGVTTWTFEACWTHAVRFLKHVGLTAERSRDKRLPWSIRHAPRPLVVEFLRAYFDGDGHVSTHVYAASASEPLLREIQLLLLNMGMVGQLRPHPVSGKVYWCLYLRGEQAWTFVREIGFVSSRKRAASQFAGDKNTNIDVVPFLVDVLRACASQNGYFRCADGATRSLGFGFFNRKQGGGISYNRLRNTPHLAEKVRTINPAWAQTLEAVLEREFFWDAVVSVEPDEPAVTYDFTVPETHSFVANGIVNHNSGGKCFKAGTLVATPGGWVPIETLQIGENVLTHEGPRRIADFMPNGVKPCYKVRTTEGYEIEVTRGHKFAYWDAAQEHYAVKPIEQFAPGDALYVLLEASESGATISLVSPDEDDAPQATAIAERTFPTKLNDELAYVVGLMYGDAELRTRYSDRVRVAFRKDEAGRTSAARFRAYCVCLFGEEPLLLGEEKNYQQIGFMGERLVAFLRANNLAKGKANNLGFPKALFQARPEVRAAFVAGMIDADGSDPRRGGWTVSLVDRAFLVELQRLLLTLGVPSKIRLSRPTRGNGQLYRLCIVGHPFVERLVGRIASYSARAGLHYVPSPGADKGWDYRPSSVPALASRIEHQEGTHETTGHGRLAEHPHVAVACSAEALTHCVPVTLLSVEPTELAETYDIEVEDVHLLCANGFYASNTRRAAKMVILNADHPDIEEFIECKADAEKKAHALIEAGYSGAFNVAGGAYDSVFFQNANHSIRATDDFMRAVELDRDWTTLNVTGGDPDRTYRARDLMHKIAQAAWVCGDPGMQFDTTINRWHPCPNTSRINASNPCFTGDSLVYTSKGLVRFRDLIVRVNDGETFQVYTHDATAKEPKPGVRLSSPTQYMVTGIHDTLRLKFSNGAELRCTPNHRVFTANRGMVRADALAADDQVMITDAACPPLDASWTIPVETDWQALRVKGDRYRAINLPLEWTEGFAEVLGHLTGDGSIGEALVSWIYGSAEDREELMPRHRMILRSMGLEPNHCVQANGTEQLRVSRAPFRRFLEAMGYRRVRAAEKQVPHPLFEAPAEIVAAYLRGLFTADGHVFEKAQRGDRHVGLGSKSEGLLVDVQRLLLLFGIQSRIYTSKPKTSCFPYVRKDGTEVVHTSCSPSYNLRITGTSLVRFHEHVGFALSRKQTTLKRCVEEGKFRSTPLLTHLLSREAGGVEVTYNLTEPANHSYIVNGVIVSNCSEYMFLDDSACNLASLNLMRFRTASREFDVEAFRHAVRVTVTAMEIMVGNASYPTDKITVNSHDYRPLGLGYANLGALLMARGLPYDSDEGRAHAAAITALMSGEGYHQSARIAERVGVFAGYERNRQPFLRVIKMHRDHVEAINHKDLLPPDLLQAARTCWDDALSVGQTNGYRNAQISVLAPTGTIGFLMDCDTTGIEPDIAIVKYKSLVGGGVFKIVNQTVPEALERLGYSAGERKAILDHIDEHDTIENAPGLAPEHLPVFDCAFRAKNGTRTIHYLGHIKMMAAAQPFLSGAISKTVNMPHEATPDDIAEAYLQAWKLGVKALAIYRDGSKKTQPLSTGKVGEPEAKTAPAEVRPFRRKLPDERQSLTHKFSVGGHEGYTTVGLYPDGTPGEIFIVMSKEGSVVSGLMDSFATSISLALQYGVPLRTLVEKFMHTRFEPSGFTGNPDIPMAKSIMDYLFRYLALKFLDKEERANVGLIADQQDEYDNEGTATLGTQPTAAAPASKPAPAGPAGTPSTTGEPRATAAERQVFVTQADAPPCPECGAITSRNGACYRCSNCGTSIGCS